MSDIILIGTTYHRISAISSFQGDERGILSEVNGEPVRYRIDQRPGRFGRRPDGTQPSLQEVAEDVYIDEMPVTELISAINGAGDPQGIREEE